MKDIKDLPAVEKILDILYQESSKPKDQFNLLMTTLTLFFSINDPMYDVLIEGLEEDLKKIVKETRLKL